MTVEFVNVLSEYLHTLYDLNRKLKTICGMDVEDNMGQYHGSTTVCHMAKA